MTQHQLSIDQHTARAVKVSAGASLAIGIVFFSYSAYAGAFLGGGSSQIFTGVAVLLMMLGSCYLIEKLVLGMNQPHDEKITH